MLTDRGRTMALAAAALWLVGRFFGIPEVSMAAVAVLALIVLAVLYTRFASARLTASRRVHPQRLFFDAEGSVRLELRNTGRLPTALLQVEDDAPPLLADATRFLLAPLQPAHGVAVRYRVHGRQRGRYTIGPLVVRLRDPFGVAARTQRFAATDELVVYPPVWRLPYVVPLGGQYGVSSDGKPRRMAAGDELANIRDYVRGDDLRKVHWRSTAHRGKLMVRQDEAPQHPQATIALDVRARAHSGHGPASSFEVAVSAAASAAYLLSERAFSVRLVTRPVAAPPRSVPWELIMDELAVVEPQEGPTLTPMWNQLARGVAGTGVLLAVVTVPDPADLREMVRAGRAFATRLAVLLDAPSFGRQRSDDSAATVHALRAAGWRVTVVRGGDRLDERWRELVLFERPAALLAAGGAR